MFAPFRPRRTSRKPRARRVPEGPRPQLRLEPIEDRLCPSGAYLVVGSFDNNSVLRYDEATGTFVDQFDPHNSASLKNPVGGVFGPDHNLYVSSSIFNGNSDDVLEYGGATGAFQTVFAIRNITSPRGVLFGQDGDLYVANGNSAADGDPASVERFDGKTGAFLDYFVPPSSGGLANPSYMVFGPDGKGDGKLDLYVAATHAGSILRYDGTTGAFKGVFVSAGSSGLDAPQGMAFGPDGNLYVASGNWFTGSNGPFYDGDFPAGAVLRFEGPAGRHPGAFLGTAVPGGSGGLANPTGLLFAPDPSGNGGIDLYVASSVQSGSGGVLIAEPGTSQVLRYGATTGAFLGTFIAPGSGGLKFPTFLTFTETDPTTLAYVNGRTHASARTAPHTAPTALNPRQVRPPLVEVVRQWNQAGSTAEERRLLGHVRWQVADLDGLTLATAIRTTITLDWNAAGWGWFANRTPRSDREFTRPGDQREQNRIDLLAVLMHEIGHVIGRDHALGGVMAEVFASDSRESIAPGV